MAGRFARLVRETWIHPCACVRHTQSPASDSVRYCIFRDSGQTMVEYALILGLVAVIAVAAFMALGPILGAAVESAGAAF